MTTGHFPIFFTLVYNGEDTRVETTRDQYHTLMSLISDRLAIEGFGICCGMGSCGTCMVTIQEKKNIFIANTLSCDVQITDDLANTTIIVSRPFY